MENFLRTFLKNVAMPQIFDHTCAVALVSNRLISRIYFPMCQVRNLLFVLYMLISEE